MLKDIAPKPSTSTVRKARKLCRIMTLPEVLLWRAFQTRPYGLKFRRQHGSDDFVLDFYCGDARLGVEVDGIAHDMGDRPERDAWRDAFFAEAGITTLRIPAANIIEAARARLPLHHPAGPAGPPPRNKLGED